MSTCFDSRRAQRGNVLLEALVSVAVTGLIGAGLAHVASGVMNSQRDAKVEQLAVTSLRGELQTNGVALCGVASVPLPLVPASGGSPAAQGASGSSGSSAAGSGTAQATVACAPAPDVTVTIDSESHLVTAPPQVKLSVATTDLGVRDADAGTPPLQMASGS